MKRALLLIALLLVLLPAAAGVAAFYYFSHDLPRIGSLQDYRPPLVTEVYAATGELIGEYFVERRYPVRLEQISPLLIQAIIAAEDDRFFEHRGINIWSILRAAVKNIRSFEIRQGGSTITQQIVKSLLLTPEKSFSRKIKEAILAMRIEKHLSKDEILNLYLNQIYFGRGAYGVEAAARVYFDSSALDLTLGEASFLAGLPKAPNYYRNPEHAEQRRRYVLLRMLKQGFVLPDEMRAAEREPIIFAETDSINATKAPYYAELVRRELEKTYGADVLYHDGLRVETSLDLSMQEAARRAVAHGVEAYDAREKVPDNESRVQAALVSLCPHSGDIKALIGGRDYLTSQFNRAVQSRRQPGSAFKPIIYAAALDKGYTPASIVVDSPVLYEVEQEDENGDTERVFWEPQNYDKCFVGPITFREALTRSRNIVTIKILKDIGVNYAVQYGKRLGIDGEFNYDLSLSLGSCGVSLLDMVTAYSAFCAQGVYAEPQHILSVTDRDGNVILQNKPRLVSALSPQTAYIMTSMLQSVVEEGTGRRVRALSRPCAGKTGTTNDVRDAWFIGYTPKLVTGVWVGFDDLAPLGKHETGAVAASPVWLEFMREVLNSRPVQSFAVPDGIVYVRINPATGYYPRTRSDEVVFECFKDGTLPTEFDADTLERLEQ